MNYQTIFESLDSLDLFETWFADHSSSDNFEENVGFWSREEELFKESFIEDYLVENNLEQDKFDEMDNDFIQAYEKAKDERIKEFAKEWFDNRIADFVYDFEKKTSFTEQGLICGRRMVVPDQDEFITLVSQGKFIKDYTGLGVCWSWDIDKAEAHWGSSEGVSVLVKALIPYSGIKLLETFLLNMDSSLGENEAEIRIESGVEIEILAVDDFEFANPVKIKS